MSWTTIEFAPDLPWPILALLIVLALAVCGFALFVGARGAAWRAAAAAVLIAALVNPVLFNERRKPLKDVAAIVVDETPSTAIGTRRSEITEALAALEKKLARFSDTLDVRVVRVRHESIAAAEDGTRLIRPLVKTFAGVPRRRIAGAILLTDGQVHDAPEAVRPDRGLPAPLHVLLAGGRDERDRRLVVVNAPRFGLVGGTVEMTVRIDDPGGKKSGSAVLTVHRDGEPVAEIPVPIGRERKITLGLDHGGPNVFELRVAAGTEELTLENNDAVIAVNGVRDRLRVLLVSGEPHAGERTWRNLLKSDPSVDLVHFTILRPPEKQDGTPINELSLISFPTRELFEAKLDEFDLVIFDRYRRRGVLPPVYLQNIVDYLRDGGALLEAVGPTFATPFSIYRTPLGKALPGAPTGVVIERGFRPRVTELGLRHPVTAELPGGPDAPAAGRVTWGRWFRQIAVEARRGQVVMSGVSDLPLLILDRVGKGRVAQLNSDHIWLWARGYEGGGPQAELLRRLAHWLMKEPDLEENSLRATVKNGRLEVVRRSLEGDAGTVEITAPDGTVRRLPLVARGGGRATASLALSQAGLYRVSDGERVAMAAAGALDPLELSDVRATAARLAPVARATGGRIAWIRDGMPDVRRIRPGRTMAGSGWIGLRRNGDYVVTGLARHPLLPSLIVLVLALGATVLAWRSEAR